MDDAPSSPIDLTSDNESKPQTTDPLVIDLCDDEDEVGQGRKRSFSAVDQEEVITVDNAVDVGATRSASNSSTVIGDWEIIMIKDSHERKDVSSFFDQVQLPWETRKLPVFDYLWIARSRSQQNNNVGQERILGYGVERKRADGLIQSLSQTESRTGWSRANQQRLAMNFVGVPNRSLLCEGTIFDRPFFMKGQARTLMGRIGEYEKELKAEGFRIERVPMKDYGQIANYLGQIHEDVVAHIAAGELDPSKCMTYQDLISNFDWFIQLGRAQKGLRLGPVMIPLILEAFPTCAMIDEYRLDSKSVIDRLLKVKSEKGRGMSQDTVKTLCENLVRSTTSGAAPVTPERKR